MIPANKTVACAANHTSVLYSLQASGTVPSAVPLSTLIILCVVTSPYMQRFRERPTVHFHSLDLIVIVVFN